jgi:hypothetical protein
LGEAGHTVPWWSWLQYAINEEFICGGGLKPGYGRL